MIEQSTKGALIRWIFVDVGDAQFGFPKKRMIGPFEYLPLFGNRMYDRFQRRSAISHTEPSGFDFRDNLGATPSDRTKVLEALLHRIDPTAEVERKQNGRASSR